MTTLDLGVCLSPAPSPDAKIDTNFDYFVSLVLFLKADSYWWLSQFSLHSKVSYHFNTTFAGQDTEQSLWVARVVSEQVTSLMVL